MITKTVEIRTNKIGQLIIKAGFTKCNGAKPNTYQFGIAAGLEVATAARLTRGEVYDVRILRSAADVLGVSLDDLVSALEIN